MKFERNPDRNEKIADEESDEALFICPVTKREMKGKHIFYCIPTCGCAISKQALQIVGKDSCPSCGKDYKQEDLIVINPTGDVYATQLARAQLKSSKKKKKQKNGEERKKKEKRKKEEKNGEENGEKKKRKTLDVPKNADASVYSSIFSTNQVPKTCVMGENRKFFNF